MIKEFFDGMVLREEQFLVVTFTKLTSTNGNQYANIELQDATGTIEAKKWTIESEDFYVFQPGNIVSINGEVLAYKGNLQVKLFSGRVLDKKSVNLSKFLIQSEFDLVNLKDRFNNLLKEIEDDEIFALVSEIFEKYDDELFSYPAAKRNHHNYLRGLITHSISMAETALYLGKKYKNIDISILVAGALLHDLGKIVELSGPAVTTYTTEGQLLGHISIGYAMLKDECERLEVTKEKAIHLQHIVLSHHGKFEYGSPVLPSTKEAILLSMIDDMDAKMELADSVLENVNEGEFSGRVFAFNDRTLYKPQK
jgi:3'-5' exoribonuclease